ncbi:MAG TPA: hypothetical protein VHG69_05590 [Thermoleophilaceae bacterium]|nr:hypothetical protein [Thermoleophilaceae bacterium]
MTITPTPESTEALTIRMAVPADAPALERLAQLDSAPRPQQVPMLVAVAEGDLCAALPLGGGAAIADPFRRTAEIVAMLAARARQLQAPERASSRWRPARFRGRTGLGAAASIVAAPHVARRPSSR